MKASERKAQFEPRERLILCTILHLVLFIIEVLKNVKPLQIHQAFLQCEQRATKGKTGF